MIEYHLWAKSTNGKIVRLYSYIGEKGENVAIKGEPTAVERDYNLINMLLLIYAKDLKYFDRTDLVRPDEELLMKIAANWSLDPTQLEERRDIKPDLGILGRSYYS